MATLITSLFSFNSIFLLSSSSLLALSARHYYLHHSPSNQHIQQSNRDLAQVETLRHFVKETDFSLEKVRIGEEENETGETIYMNTLITMPRKERLEKQRQKMLLLQQLDTSSSGSESELDSPLPLSREQMEQHEYGENSTTRQHRRMARKLVLCHGWGSSLMCYAPVIDELALKYDQIYAVDLLGWGNSSKVDPHSIGSTAEEIQHWWVNSLEKWRQSVGLEPGEFDLCGHSFGGFISSSYALHYPDNVNRLILVAPVGLAPWKPEFCEPKTWAQSLLAKCIWDYHQTPQKLLKMTGPFSRFAWNGLGKAVNYYGLDETMWNGFFFLHMDQSCGDVAFFKLLTRNGWELPLRDSLFQELQCPLRVIYGEDDWVNMEVGKELVEHRKHPEHATDAVYVPNMGHHLYFEMADKDFVHW
eukprot:CAMPEP_0117445280 /NCGR_PEP_ID=MMETSP0759-20121206/5708_1 /TAXON_ID=63605 /ORGANISM="Percolomonas cosmopolitus, Strain WS" /LENGTH=416 /DNA_ID=CAMNT_0005237439 /DNA_START=421 /DNA_END=1668 /DNA_ORIENTATION=-